MSETYPPPYGDDPRGGARHTDAETSNAKDAAAGVAQSAGDAAKDVAGTAKDEAASVIEETKSQAADLFHTALQEFRDQAATQQERVAEGLSAVGDELSSMSRQSNDGGVGADLVRRAGEQATSMSHWIGSRDPSGVLDELRAFARRRPVVFVGAALAAGIVAGRLTRAMIANAKDDGSDSSASSRVTSSPERRARLAVPAESENVATAEAPLYAESAARFGEGETSYERPDTV